MLGVTIHAADLTLSLLAGALKAEYPMALGDCFAAALAQQLGAVLVTGGLELKQAEKVVRIEWIGD
jgi:predicted nucleic acid-binding protein